MNFALSTHWNAHRHIHGEALLEEILALGFDRVELGYDLRIDLVLGVQKMVQQGAVRVDSLHNFCPVPVGAIRPGPEIYTLASSDRRERQNAVHYTSQTLRFAAEVGARVVVVHAGNVEMDHFSRELFDLCATGRQFTPEYERIRLKLQVQRDKKSPRQLQYLEEGIAQLLPVLQETNVVLAFENLPTWESIPTEVELESLLRRVNSDHVRYWHDVGHGQIRHNLGFINQDRWLERLSPWMAGMHVHDVIPPASDHVMPPRGQVDFKRLQKFGAMDIIRVIEPTTQTPAAEIAEALVFLRDAWTAPTATQEDAPR